MEENYNSDNEDDIGTSERSHNRLLSALSGLDGKKRNKQLLQRTEFGDVSDHHVPSSQAGVEINDLLGVLNKKNNSLATERIKKMLTPVQKKSNEIDVLSKADKLRMERSMGYIKIGKEMKKWDAVVDSNRKANSLEFPLIQPTINVKNSTEVIKRFQAHTALEKQVQAALDVGREHKLENVLTPAEAKIMEAYSVEEAKERRAELQKYRVLLSYKQAKACRQKKIKSKKYHRILKKEREKATEKSMDELKRTDPEAYRETVEEIMKQRAEERMSLKHKGTSKAMKKRAIYSKFDEKSRQQLADMKEKCSELMQKPMDREQSDSSDSDQAEEMDPSAMNHDLMPDIAANNPWMSLKTVVNKTSVRAQYDLGAKVKCHDGVTTHIPASTASQMNPDSTVEDTPRQGEARQEQEGGEGEEEEGEGEGEEGGKEVDDDTNSPKKKKQKKSKTKTDLKINTPKKTTKSKKTPNSPILPELDRRNFNSTSIDDIFSLMEKKQLRSKPKAQLTKAERSLLQRDKQIAKDDNRIISLRKIRKSEAIENNDDSSDEELDDNFNPHGGPKRRQPDSGNLQSTKRCKTQDDLENLPTIESDVKPGEDISSEPKTDSKDIPETKKSRSETRKEAKLAETPVVPCIEIETSVPLLQVDEEEGDPILDEDEKRRMTIAEAFEDDDVIDTFREEKQAMTSAPKTIDLSLPGWGHWAGKDIVVSKRQKKKNKKFMIRAKNDAPRRDRNLTNVVINETKDTSVSVHQVNRVPFPFNNQTQFESSIRQPIGSTWQPQTAVKEITRPSIIVKSGSLIEPIEKKTVFNKDLSLKRKFQKNKIREKEAIF